MGLKIKTFHRIYTGRKYTNKIYLRILRNKKKSTYIFEQWSGKFLELPDFKYKKTTFETTDKNAAKIMMGLLGLKKIKKYKVFMFWNCLIEFED